MAKATINLGTGSVPKLLFRLALPTVAAQIVNMLYNLIDRVYLGGTAVGTDALAGLGVCFPIILIVSAFGVLVGMGGAPLASIRLGEGDKSGAEKILNNGAVLLFIIGAVLTVLLFFLGEPLLVAFGAPTTALPHAVAYLKTYAIGTLFVMFTLGLNNFISSQGFAITAMLTVTLGAALNIALDPLFIFVFNMGVRGAATATVISQGAACVWVVLFFLSKRTTLRLKPSMFGLKKSVVLPMLALGVSPFIMQVTESAVQIVFNVQIHAYTGGDQNYTAALTVMMSVMQMITLPLNGLGMGTQPLIGFNYGAGNTARVKQTVKYLVIVSLAICVTVWVLCLACPQLFAYVFSATEAVTAIVAKFMPVFMMGTVMFFAQFALQNAFIALGQAKISISLALLRKVILLIPLAFVLPLFLGVDGIFWAEGIADLTAGIVTAMTFWIAFGKILLRREKVLAQSEQPLKKEDIDNL